MALPRGFKSLKNIRFYVIASTAAMAVAAFQAAPSAAQETAAAATQEVRLAPDAPSRYVVQPRDTLWDIAAKFLRDPWLWPEVWYVNPQVENPHLIYPGDELVLSYVDGQPRVSLAGDGGGYTSGGAKRLSPTMRSAPLTGAISAIHYDTIARFMGRPSVLTRDEVKDSAYIVRTREEHLIAAAGNDAYIRDLEGAAVGNQYNVYKIGRELRDPEDGDLLGYEGIFNATGTLTRTGEPATLRLTESVRETLDGDRVLPTVVEVNTNFALGTPQGPVDGVIMSVAESKLIVGQYEVVVINRGTKHGLLPGHTLGIWRTGDVIKDKVDGGMGSNVRLPDERTGVFIVFKTYDRMSYGLVMSARTEIHVGDTVRQP
jgi:LysM repeat protein